MHLKTCLLRFSNFVHFASKPPFEISAASVVLGSKPPLAAQSMKVRCGPEATFASLWPNGSKVRTADLYAKRSEGPVSALHVEMCMAQQLLPSALGVE
jgi:hypothetical protein